MAIKVFDSLDKLVSVQANPGDLTLVDPPVPAGGKMWRVHMNPQSTMSWDQNQRVHSYDPTPYPNGTRLCVGAAFFIPPDRPAGEGWDAIFEYHQPWHGGDVSYGGPAPGYGYMTGDKLGIVLRGGPMLPDNQSPQGQYQGFIQHQWGDPGSYGYVGPYANGISANLIKGRLWTLLIDTYLASDDEGWVYVEIDGKVAVPKTFCPTNYSDDVLQNPGGPSGGNVMPINGYRKGGPGINQNDAVHYMMTAVGTEATAADEVRAWLAAFVGGTTPPPPPPPPPASQTIVSSIKQGDTLTGSVAWKATTDTGATVEFWANNQKLATVPGPVAEYQLDTTKLPAGANTLGFGITWPDGTRTTPQVGTVTVTNTPASPPEPAGFAVSVLAETTTTVTIGWPHQDSQEGYVPLIDGSELLADGKRHASVSKTVSRVKIGRPSDGKAHTYGVRILGVIEEAATGPM